MHLYIQFSSSAKNCSNLHVNMYEYIFNLVYEPIFFHDNNPFQVVFHIYVFKYHICMRSCLHAIPVLFHFSYIMFITLNKLVHKNVPTASLLTTKAYNLEFIYSAHKTAKHDRRKIDAIFTRSIKKQLWCAHNKVIYVKETISSLMSQTLNFLDPSVLAYSDV